MVSHYPNPQIKFYSKTVYEKLVERQFTQLIEYTYTVHSTLGTAGNMVSSWVLAVEL